MFLSILNENEGKNFLELAHLAMLSDGMIHEKEAAIYKNYQLELELQDYQLKHKEYKQLVTEFQASTKRAKRVVIIELAGVLDSDDPINHHEQQWIFQLGRDWEFRDTEITKMVRWTEDFNDLLEEAYEYINKR